MLFRRALKTYWLRRYSTEHHIEPRAPAAPAGG
jgi:hypothetical protein